MTEELREKIARLIQVGKIEGRRSDGIADKILELPEIKEALDLKEKLLLGWKLHPRKL